MAKLTNPTAIIDPDSTTRPVFVLSDQYPHIDVPWHSHRRTQLVHVSEGVLTVITRSARFVIPPQRAVWIASGVEHRISSKHPFWLTTCYLEPALTRLRAEASVVSIDRLTDELLIEATHFGGDYPIGGHEERLIAVLLDRLPELPPANISLPQPTSDRLGRITDMLLRAPSRGETLAELAEAAAMTERTAARLFQKETGLTFGQWRQQMRLQSALERLGTGASVTEAAFDVGYQDVSSFITAFKALFGKTPAHILRPGRHETP